MDTPVAETNNDSSEASCFSTYGYNTFLCIAVIGLLILTWYMLTSSSTTHEPFIEKTVKTGSDVDPPSSFNLTKEINALKEKQEEYLYQLAKKRRR
jgi:hypothetical protein